MKKILFVDDEKFFIEPIKMLLLREKFEVLVAHDGMSGLKMAREELPDMIILDLMLPVLNGYQICRLLKYDNKFKSIPVIILSAKDTDNDKKIGQESGADLYLTKPINAKIFVENIKNFFGE